MGIGAGPGGLEWKMERFFDEIEASAQASARPGVGPRACFKIFSFASDFQLPLLIPPLACIEQCRDAAGFRITAWKPGSPRTAELDLADMGDCPTGLTGGKRNEKELRPIYSTPFILPGPLHRIAREVEKIDHKWRAVRALRRFRSRSERTRATFSQDAREHEVTFIFESFMQNPVQRVIAHLRPRVIRGEPMQIREFRFGIVRACGTIPPGFKSLRPIV
jgi:hypothetical protein